MEEDYEMFKVVVIGSVRTGKTCISSKYIRNQFNQMQKETVGVQFLSKFIHVRNQKVKVTIWDTAGQQRFKSLSKIYYKGASGVLIVYDITNPQSYLDVEAWIKLANEHLNLKEVQLMIVGNKADLEEERIVEKSRPLKQYKEKFDIECWEVSAKTGRNIQEMFTQLLERIYVASKYRSSDEIPISSSSSSDNPKLPNDFPSVFVQSIDQHNQSPSYDHLAKKPNRKSIELKPSDKDKDHSSKKSKGKCC